MSQVLITQHGIPNDKGDAWSYNVSYTRQGADEDYTVSAWSLDDHYLLEDKLGRAEQKPFQLFGVENLADYQYADERLYERAKERAEGLMSRLTPELFDKTTRVTGQETKKEKLGKLLKKKKLAKQGGEK